MDSSTINKLIPQMFDEMRYNLGDENSSKKGANASSAITTQSLLQELECLDKIIPMVESVDNCLQNALPSHLNRIHEICKSTNTLLDSWINIQSQAGHMHKLMSSEGYLKYTSTHLKQNDSTEIADIIVSEEREIEDLKQQIKKEEHKKELIATSGSKASAAVSKPSLSTRERMGKPRSRFGAVPATSSKSARIPGTRSRLTKPTVSSSRKMFK